MAIQQASVNLRPTTAFPGLYTRRNRVTDLQTGVASEDLKYGDLVYFSEFSDDGPTKVSKCTTTSTRFDGVVGFEAFPATTLSSTPLDARSPVAAKNTIKANDAVPVLVKGQIWLDGSADGVVTGAVTAGASVFYDKSAAKLATGTAASGDLVVHGAFFLSGGAQAAGKLYLLELNLPGYLQVA